MSNADKDKLEHELALQRFGGIMPKGNTSVNDQTPKEYGKMLRVNRIGKDKQVIGKWS